MKAARVALGKRTGRATPPNALTVKDALEEWFADQIEDRYRVTNSTAPASAPSKSRISLH